MAIFVHRPIALLALTLSAAAACTGDRPGGGDTESSTDPVDTTGDTSTGTTPEPTGTTAEPTGTTAAEDPSSGTTDAPGEVDQPPCLDTPTVLAADEASALGFSAEELLAGKLGPRATALRFTDELPSMSDAWKGKELPLTVELRWEQGEVRWIDSEINPDFDAENEFPDECLDRLEVDVQLDFVTGGGEFDEHRAAVLRATSAQRAELTVDLDPPGLTGSFDETTLYSDPKWVVDALIAQGVWQDALAGGSLLSEVLAGGDEDFVIEAPYAAWGDPID